MDVKKFTAASKMAGFKNQKPNPTGSVSIPSLGLGSGGWAKYSFTMNAYRSNAVTTFRVRLTGLESFWRQVQGYIQVDKPDLASIEYSVQIQGYYSGLNFICDVYIINQLGAPITTPAFTVDGELNIFVAPF